MNLLLVSVLSQLNVVPALPPYFRNIRFNIIFPYLSVFSEWSPFRFSDLISVCISRLSLIDLVLNTGYPEDGGS
jgi:hypothetical protein